MGSGFSKFVDKFLIKRPIKALVLGLDSVGKTAIIYKAKLGVLLDTIPTLGINVQTLEFKRTIFTIWDFSKQQKIRQLLRHYYPATQALIYVVDSSDRERINEAKDQLNKLLKQDELRNSAFLVLANKQDLKGAMSINELFQKLGLQQQKNRVWLIQGTSAVTGEGLFEGFKWLEDVIQKQK